jgi:hypothetical protein
METYGNHLPSQSYPTFGKVGSAPAPAIAADNSVLEVTTQWQIELGVKLKHCSTPSGKTHEETAAEMTSSQNE